MKNILILVSVLFLLFSCAQKNENNVTLDTPDDTRVSDVASESNDTITIDQVVSQIKDKYKNNASFNTCITNNVDLCMMEQSYDSQVDVDCDDYILEANKKMCRENNTLMKAREEKDESLCEGLENKENCRFEVLLAKGLEMNDISVCDNVSEAYKIQCNNDIINNIARSQLDEETCDDIISYDDSEFEKQFCIEEVAFLKQEAERMQALEQENNSNVDVPEQE